MFSIPVSALKYGFATGDSGTLSGKTLMCPEFRRLLAACPIDARPEHYTAAIVDDNVLGKPTSTTRIRSRRHLREWYALDRDVLIFRALRDLWDADADAQPLLALLCAAARNAALRRTARVIFETPIGASVTPAMLARGAAGGHSDRYNATTAGSIGRNAAASWRQSGHLGGGQPPVRTPAVCRPPAVVYALVLGYLCDSRGETLFHTGWARLLDASEAELRQQATLAAQRGWLDYRHAGGVTDVTFGRLLPNTQEKAVR